MQVQPNKNMVVTADIDGNQKKDFAGDEFLTMDNMNPVLEQARERAFSQVLHDTEELFRQNRWDEMAALYCPIKDKCPEIENHPRLHQIRGKLAFALGQLKRFDEAIGELTLCIEQAPNDFYHHGSLAYTAYNSLYAAKNREVFLAGKIREDRISLAHRHFAAATAIRPDNITNFYRRGMLLKQLENKSRKAMPMFQQAVKNWEALDEESRDSRQREFKNYVKSLYHLAGCLLESRHPKAVDSQSPGGDWNCSR